MVLNQECSLSRKASMEPPALFLGSSASNCGASPEELSPTWCQTAMTHAFLRELVFMPCDKGLWGLAPVIHGCENPGISSHLFPFFSAIDFKLVVDLQGCLIPGANSLGVNIPSACTMPDSLCEHIWASGRAPGFRHSHPSIMGKKERQTDYRITQILVVVRGRKGFEWCRFDFKVHTMKTLLLSIVGIICEIFIHLRS